MDRYLYLNDIWEDEPDIRELVRAAFLVDVSSYAEAIALLAALSGYISYEEIYSVFGRLPSIFYKKVLPKLTKEELAIHMRFDKPDGSCVSCFRLTRKGYNRIKGEYGRSVFLPKALPPSDTVNMHTYASGYNLYQLIRLKMPFTWVKEAPYDNPLKEGLTWRSELGFRTDCNAIFRTADNGIRIMHIEEDRFRENISVLYDKLFNYHSKGCFDDPREVTVFSIRAAGVAIPSVSKHESDYLYSSKYLKELVRCMEVYGAEDARLLVGRSEIFARQGYLCGLVNRISSDPEDPVPISLLRALVSDLGSGAGICSLQQQDFNAKHKEASNLILSGLAMPMIRLFRDKKPDTLCLLIIQGRTLGVIPTSLISSRIPYLMLSDFPDKRDLLVKMLVPYFGEVSFDGELANPLYIGNYKNRLTMRNAFRHRDGTVCVEFPMMDMASWIRCYLFTKYIRDFSDSSIQIVCVFDTKEDAESFFSMCDYDAEALSLSKTKPSMYGVLFDDIRRRRGQGLFLASGEGEGRYIIDIHPTN